MSITKLECMELKDTRYSVYPYDGYNLEEILGKFYEAIKECNDLSFSLQEFNSWIISEGLSEEVLKQLTKVDWDKVVNSELYQSVIERLLNTNNRVEEVKNELETQLQTISEQIVIINSSMTINEINSLLKKSGTFLFKKGEYILNNGEKIIVKSNTDLIFEDGAIVKFIDNTSHEYDCLFLYDCRNVTIENVTIIGNRKLNNTPIKPTDKNFFGFGLSIYGCQNINIKNPKIYDCWGDGIYIGYRWASSLFNLKTKNIKVTGALVDYCVRNGITIAGGSDIYIDNCVIKNIDGALPQSGIDIEPENGVPSNIDLELKHVYLDNIVTENCVCGISTQLVLALHLENININNHKAYNCSYGLQLRANTNVIEKYNINYTNAILTDIKKSGIYISNKSNNSILNINNVKIIGKLDGGETFEYDSAISVVLDSNDFEYGNINLNNIDISCNGYSYNYKCPLSFIRKSPSTKIYKNINIDNINYDIKDRYFNVETNALERSTTIIKNCNIELTTKGASLNYFQQYANIITYKGMTTACELRVDDDYLDGKYIINALNTNGYALTVKFNNTNVSPSDKKVLVFNGVGNIEFIKNGNDLFITNIVNTNV